MKLNTKYTDVVGSLGTKTINSTVSQQKLGKLWDMLQNPYKNNIGSIIREQSSNMEDAHREAGVTDAIRIQYGKDESGFYISFIDVGIGISTHRMDNIYSVYLESTKEDSNDFIGAFGLGSKSPLSYQDIFYINTRYDGIEYNYMMRKGSDGPAIDLLNSSETTERNGTEIKIYIKNETDLKKFLEETFLQLHYFENVLVDCSSIKPLFQGYYQNIIRDIIAKIENDYTIIEGKHFLLRSNTHFTKLHLSIGNVCYPIDYENLGIDIIFVPVALKFNIGDLEVIQTREDVRYTYEVINAIKEKIELLKEEFVDIYNNKVQDGIAFNDFLDGINLSSIQINLGKNIIDITRFVNGKSNELICPQIIDLNYEFKSLDDLRRFQKYLSTEFLYFTNKINVNKFNKHLLGDAEYSKTFNSAGSISNSQRDIPHLLKRITIQDGSFCSLRKVMVSITALQDSNIIIKNKETSYSVKKNKYIFKELHKDWYYHDTYILNINKNIKFSPYVFRVLYNGFRSTCSNITVKEFEIVYNFILKTIKDSYDNTVKLDYDKITVPDKWWKDNTVKIKGAVEYDRTLLAFDKLDYSLNWDRTGFRYNLQDFLKPHKITKILISKEEQSIYCSNNNDYTKTPLERIIKIINTNGYIGKTNKQSVELYATATRNYDKILKFRDENSNIFTVSEYLSNEKIQMRTLSKLATVLKIRSQINEFNVKTKGHNFSDLKDLFVLFNNKIYQDYLDVIGICDVHYSFINEEQLSSLLKDFDVLDTTHMLYDRELISKFNNVMQCIKESRINLVQKDFNAILYFALHYKPSKYNYCLDNNFYKHKSLDELNELCKKHYDHSYKDLTPEESLSRFIHGLGFNSRYSSFYIDARAQCQIIVARFMIKDQNFNIQLKENTFKVEEEKVEVVVEEVEELNV